MTVVLRLATAAVWLDESSKQDSTRMLFLGIPPVPNKFMTAGAFLDPIGQYVSLPSVRNTEVFSDVPRKRLLPSIIMSLELQLACSMPQSLLTINVAPRVCNNTIYASVNVARNGGNTYSNN